MGDRIPNITLTNPFNRDQAPSPAQSPIRSGGDSHSNRWPELHSVAGLINGGSSVTPPGSRGRPDSSNGSSWTSPIRLKRSRSNNAFAGSNGPQAPIASDEDDITARDAQAGMDPLSQHLMKRTSTLMTPASSRPNTANSSSGKDGSPGRGEGRMKERSPAPAVRPPGPLRNDTSYTETSEGARRDLRKGVKAVSFLSKLMGGAKKKDAQTAAPEEISVSGDHRPEGVDAAVFSEPTADNMSFVPRFPQPPTYIKVGSKNKPKREFDRLFLAQELSGTNQRRMSERQPIKLRRKGSLPPNADHTIWAMEFSKDGKYLAAAGADMVVRVWAVLGSSEDRQKHEKQEAQGGKEANGKANTQRLSAPVFQSQPVREFEAHTATILDLSWSKNNFLLSSSMDKTVRLWHMSRPACLCTFKHNDFVPSISFHPEDDRFFLAGSLDSKLRLWSIPDKSVAYVAQVPDMITAVAFTPDGKHAMAGCFSGLVMFFETEGLKYQSQMHVRSSRGQNAKKGSKITGLQAAYSTEGSAGDVLWLLVTSNDSRIRLYNFRDKSLELKLKGNENNCSQIRATFSECGKYVTCGSEDKRAYIWSLRSSSSVEDQKRDRHPMEFFEAHDSITTVVRIAPSHTRGHLDRSNDPVYDICNPPPVTLMSRAERAASQSSSKAPSVVQTSNLPRAIHSEGNIFVTADFEGKIKVFRQDCAYSKRKLEDFDRSSIFGKRASVRSTGSLNTRGSQLSLREARTSTSTQGGGDRIVTWRQGVASTSALVNSGASMQQQASRSGSPGQSVAKRTKLPPEQGGGSPTSKDVAGGHPPEAPTRPVDLSRKGTKDSSASGATTSSTRGYPGFESRSPPNENLLNIQNGQSYTYYDVEQMKQNAGRAAKFREAKGSSFPALTPVRSVSESEGGLATVGTVAAFESGGRLAVRPSGANREASFVSRLSDEGSSGDGSSDEGEGLRGAGNGRGSGRG
ncbi:hypothetical protein LTR91_021907 [Friedmanniomyces endolithicus]|uniref:Anaphase-promoting complex subunit 4 WD40 domain-containing protein n=1 Tax=Friedmanniomyces endolithicus TaxID=329885 RepID=A0AAN6HBS6_9PEZI|nr:hypothetical protein LTR57_004802 [Friedmanniomyces endolithicus]KAK0957355.1 hypothetical protein LTR91_021907 [Friedmanniomyces endolithicus]KAK1006148.1 hypothetical protein LTS01_003224 [Friedmanniomyces endolithicus]KAK1048893.1 hypothetical protein LTS16_004001 [Friedmanniomyces endolithicus]